MQKPQSNTETYVGLYSFCKKFDLDYYKIRYRLIKCRSRIFRFNGIRYVLKENLEKLPDLPQRAIDWLKEL